MPKEVLRQILLKLPDHVSMLEVAKATETFKALVEQEQKQWRTLCEFHFSQAQIDKYQVKVPNVKAKQNKTKRKAKNTFHNYVNV